MHAWVQNQEFMINEDKFTSGVVKKGKYQVKLDYIIKIIALVEAGSSTGYLAEPGPFMEK